MHLIPKSMTVAAAEAFLADVSAAPAAVARTPTRGQHHQAGGEAAVVQGLITWSQAVAEPSLQTFVRNETDPDAQIDALTRQFFGLAAALLCDTAAAFDGATIFERMRGAALDRLTILQSERPREASRGPQFEVLCADHLGRSGPRLLYDRDSEGQPVLKSIESFIALAALIRTTIVTPELSTAMNATFDDALGGALYELFRNTEDHARVDDAGDKLARSLRGVQARRHAISPAKLNELVAESPPLASFCARLRPPRPSNRDVQLIEISVFDSGAGYAAAITGRPLAALSPEEEADAVRRCFLKHATSKDRSRSGLGLCNVVDILRERGGFLRLRTGRQSLYADLGAERGFHYGTLPHLHDWPTAGQATARAAGSLMTVLLPLVLDP